MHNSGNYCAMVSLTPTNRVYADMGLAASLITAPTYIGMINQWLALVGGILGISIAVLRLWRVWRGKE